MRKLLLGINNWLHRRALDRNERRIVAGLKARVFGGKVLSEYETMQLLERFEALDATRQLRGAPSLRSSFYPPDYTVRPSAEWPVVYPEHFLGE